MTHNIAHYPPFTARVLSEASRYGMDVDMMATLLAANIIFVITFVVRSLSLKTDLWHLN